jgi:holin-like protein
MLTGISYLLIFQLIGEVLSRLLELPVPGPVMGMVLLFAFLVWRKGPPEELRVASEGLLRYIALLYVPAGVGLMVHYRLIASDWAAIVLALVVSTTVTMALTLWVLQRLQRKRGGGSG